MPKSNPLTRLFEKFASTRFAGKYLLPLACRIDRWLLPASGGRWSTTVIWPVLLLNTTGAKSGQPRTTPLLYISDGENKVVIASNGGNPHHPAWYYNLRAHPEASYMLHGRTCPCLARDASGAERERLWRLATQLYAGYDSYQIYAQGREIPVVVLEPRQTT